MASITEPSHNTQPAVSLNLTLPSSSGLTPRKYRIHLPPDYSGTQQLPLILACHGRGQDALYQEELTQFSNPKSDFNGIAVYPEGAPLITANGEVKQWQGDPDAPSAVSDVTFTLELLDHLQATYCIDAKRIYAAGFSNGGGFVGLLASDPVVSTRFAAFAIVSGAMYLESATQALPVCRPGRLPLPILVMHGLKDEMIAYVGGLNMRKNASSVDVRTYVEDWARRNGFQAGEKKTSTLCSGEKEVVKYAWGDEMVVHYTYANLGHDWPRSVANENASSLTCEEAEGTNLILNWFGKWTL